MVEVQEIKGHLVNVKNSLNFLNKIGVPVSSHNDSIDKIMDLLKEGNIRKAKEEVLFLRKETSGILSRMDNIHNGLLEIEREIARLAKEKKGTIALRRLYSQCRLALKDKDYGQVQLFIIKMDKIIATYRFLESPTVLVDIDDGEEIVDVITKLELGEMRKRRGLRDDEEALPLIAAKRYTKEDEDLPVLVPIYDGYIETTSPEEDANEQRDRKSGDLTSSLDKSPLVQLDMFAGSPADTRNLPSGTFRSRPTGKLAGDAATPERGCVVERAPSGMSLRMNRILMTIRENSISDEDIADASDILRILMKNEDWKGANEIADELEKLIDSFNRRKNTEAVSRLREQAKTAMISISKGTGTPDDIRIVYERGEELMSEGETEKSMRLFSETVSMCGEREGIEIRENRLDRLAKLEERLSSIPAEWSDMSEIRRRLADASSSVDGSGDAFDEVIRPLEDEIEGVFASYWKEKLGSLDESLSRNIARIKETGGYRYELHRILERAREQAAEMEWKKAELIYQCGMEEIKVSGDIAEYEKELDLYEKGLAYLPEQSATYLKSEQHIGECRNRLLRRDLKGFLEVYDALKEVSQDDIIRNRAHSNIMLLDKRIPELPEGDFRDSMQKRYFEAKSKIDDGKYYNSLELSKRIVNEITVMALEEIRRS